MICTNGHAFDRITGGQCPMCGAGIALPMNEAKKFEITRADVIDIAKALDAARIVAKASMVQWPEVRVAADLIETGIARIESLRPKVAYQRRRAKT